MTADWLSQLAPDRAPPPPAWWPLAPGWWILATLVLLGLVAAAVWHWRRHRSSSTHWLRHAEHTLTQLARADCDDAAFARQLQDLLRRYAVTHFGRATVAELSGQRWVDFVVEHGGSQWSGKVGQQLLRCAYSGESLAGAAEVRQRWLDGARAFLKAST